MENCFHSRNMRYLDQASNKTSEPEIDAKS